jgi:apolipoprotein N-acyltransferase
MLQISKDSTLLMRSKQKLVPYEERRPYYLRWFDRVYFYFGGEDWNYSYPAGRQGDLFPVVGRQGNVLPLICYEAVFYAFSSQKIDSKTEFITCAANEIWYHGTEGVEQAYLLCKILAICAGKTVVRSSDFGVSAVIDAQGFTTKKCDNAKPQVLKAKIQTNRQVTFYAMFGDWIGLWCVCFSVIV